MLIFIRTRIIYTIKFVYTFTDSDLKLYRYNSTLILDIYTYNEYDICKTK